MNQKLTLSLLLVLSTVSVQPFTVYADPSGGGGLGNSESKPINPIADAGNDISAVEQGSVLLDGSSSTDLDGSISAYRWFLYSIQGELPRVNLYNDRTDHPSFVVPDIDPPGGSYMFKLQVVDNDDLKDSDLVTVSVKPRSESDVDTGDGDVDTGDGDVDTGDGDVDTGDGDVDTGDGDVDTGDGDGATIFNGEEDDYGTGILGGEEDVSAEFEFATNDTTDFLPQLNTTVIFIANNNLTYVTGLGMNDTQINSTKSILIENFSFPINNFTYLDTEITDNRTNSTAVFVSLYGNTTYISNLLMNTSQISKVKALLISNFSMSNVSISEIN